jgi:hypothetical protein
VPAEAQAQNKSQYSFFRPTPDGLMRDMTTDRPDTTEVPFTVDAGHFQLETHVLGYGRSFRSPEGDVTNTFDVMTSNLRIGLTNDIELSLVGRPYGSIRTRGSNASSQYGTGGFDVRMKFNIWGNDKFEAPGSTGFALLPYITLPTDRFNGISNDKIDGGISAIWAIKFNDTFNLGINASVAAERLGDIPAYHPGGILTFSLGHGITEKFGFYYEAILRYGVNDGLGEIFTLGGGITYKVNKNLQLDAGVNFGVTHASDRINPFVGFSARY